jgi:hypothetical protein
MRYYYESKRPPIPIYGDHYICNHPVYDVCTLFKIKDRGLAVIQQRFNQETKSTSWGAIDSEVANELYLHPKFREYFNQRSGKETNGLYPTVTVRQIMWALRMKPLKKERWETVFDRKDI